MVEGMKIALALSETKAFKAVGSKLWDKVAMPGTPNIQSCKDDLWYGTCKSYYPWFRIKCYFIVSPWMLDLQAGQYKTGENNFLFSESTESSRFKNKFMVNRYTNDNVTDQICTWRTGHNA